MSPWSYILSLSLGSPSISHHLFSLFSNSSSLLVSFCSWCLCLKRTKPESLTSYHSSATVYSSFRISQKGGRHLFYLIFICSIHCIVVPALVFCWQILSRGSRPSMLPDSEDLFCFELIGNLCCIWCCWPLLPPWKSLLLWTSSMTLLSADSSFTVSSQFSS